MTKLLVSEDDLEEVVQEVLKTIDADAFARIAGELLGGECYYFGTSDYIFYPDENYFGALDKVATIGGE